MKVKIKYGKILGYALTGAIEKRNKSNIEDLEQIENDIEGIINLINREEMLDKLIEDRRNGKI